MQNQEIDLEGMVNTIMQWSNINSGSFNIPGLEGMAAVISEAFAVLDCERSEIPLPMLERIDPHGVTSLLSLAPMLRFCKRSDAPVKILLAGHMDTVFDVDHPFQRSERKTENVLVGPGVTDMKGGLVIMLEALKMIERHPKRDNIGWEVLINPDEEIGSIASATFMEERAKLHHVGLLFEPALDEMGNFAGARKGSGKFTFVVRGLAAHAGRDFSMGRSAIYAISKMIQSIVELNGKRENVTINVGQVEGGGAVNVVPDLAICRIDVRIHQTEDEDWVSKNLENIVREANLSDGIRVEMSGKFTRKPKHIVGKTKSLYELVQKIAENLQQKIAWFPSGGCCDGNNFSAVGLPNIDSLGAIGGKIHSSDEYLLIEGLVARTTLTTAILTHFCEHGW